jgi:hypothetical protein
MTMGITSTGSLGDSLPRMLSSARQVNEYVGVMVNAVDRQRLGENMGNTWREVRFAKINAASATELQEVQSPSQLDDTLFTVTPSTAYAFVVITDAVKARLDSVALAKMGGLLQNAVQRKMDVDGLTQVQSFSNTLAGTGTTLSFGHLLAGVTNVNGNTTEPHEGPVNIVLHSFQLHDVQSEIVSGIGTYTVPVGLTQNVFLSGVGMVGTIGGANVLRDDNIAVDSTPDANGSVHGINAIVLVEGRGPVLKNLRNEKLGAFGADELLLAHEYAYGERRDVWGRRIRSDATAPTS